MRISNKPLCVALVCYCGFSTMLHADELTLAGGTARLSGTLRSINEAGVVELSSPLSAAPLLLKSGAVEKVVFSDDPAAPDLPGAVIELTNGDLLPANIEAMDEAKLTVTSPEAGRLEIPREVLASLQLGVRSRKAVYAGPLNLEEWTGGEGGSKNWNFEDHGLVAKGPATASRNFDLPGQFILRFTLKWQANQIPNFQVYFADPMKAKGVPCDRYYLQFGGAGLEIKREAATGKRYNTIALLNRTPNQYADRELKVEIRADRAGSRLQLFLNGEPEGSFADPIAPVPAGTGITLICNSPDEVSQEIREIEIVEFDDSRNRHRSEERGDAKTDSLISREDDRWGGRLLDIRNAGEGLVYRFKSDFGDEPLELPAADVSTVFFATGNAPKADANARPFVLRLRGEGSLRVSSCRFSGDAVSAVHPLLGPLDFRREGIVALERPASKPKPAPEK